MSLSRCPGESRLLLVTALAQMAAVFALLLKVLCLSPHRPREEGLLQTHESGFVFLTIARVTFQEDTATAVALCTCMPWHFQIKVVDVTFNSLSCEPESYMLPIYSLLSHIIMQQQCSVLIGSV
ncbi:hypothetical protein DR999_PMT13013 [Platysternon megacephalum]|uniref:Uncharacterized protein n=1 Tax=Platysternon megacephalum TaxID=55544 RepID=A0A4D9E9I3_9SAUR|nr:hypothetical protein DR999_PMT13013 [Platysternon megacephalum]